MHVMPPDCGAEIGGFFLKGIASAAIWDVLLWDVFSMNAFHAADFCASVLPPG